MDDLILRLSAAHGYFFRSEAMDAGMTDPQLRGALRTRRLHRVTHGVYAPYAVWEALPDVGRHLLRARAVLRRAKAPVALCGVSAVIAWGGPTWCLSLGDAELLRLDGRAGRREAGVGRHRGRVLGDDVTTHCGMAVTSPARTVLDILAAHRLEVAVVVADHFLRAGLMTVGQLEHCAAGHLRKPGSLRVGLLLALVDGTRESVGESRLFVLCWRGGVPRPRAQVEVHDERGRLVARLDFAWPEARVWVEFDGKQKYVEHRRPGESVVDAVLREKKREELISRLTGWRCIRLTWADLERPQQTAAYLLSVLAGGPVFGQRTDWSA